MVCGGPIGNRLRRERPLCSLKLPALVAAVSSKQTGMELMNELARRTGQLPAVLEQLRPELFGRRLERHRTEGITHLPQQHRQVRFKTTPVTPDEFSPTRHLRRGLAIKAGGDRRRVDRPIWLSKLRQTAYAHPTMPAQEPSHPDQQDQRGGGGYVTVVVSQCFQGARPLAIGTVFRRLDLLVMVLLGILLGGQ